MPMKKLDHDAAAWEKIARDEPYFAVLSDGDDRSVESSRIANDAFFKTGEDDISALFAAVTTLFRREVRLESVLDFGCGAGRLTLPLARRAGHVLAVDIAPTILSHARQNAERARLGNISFSLYDDIVATAGPSFDFICSLLVFQYIPPSVGYALIRSLTTLLRSDGIAALQLRLHEGNRLHRLTSLARRQRGSGYDSGVSVAERAPLARRYRYDERLVARAVEKAGGSVVSLLPAHDRRTDGAVLIIRKC